MPCYRCDGALYWMYHSFANPAPIVEKTNSIVQVIKESDISSKSYDYQPSIPRLHKKSEAITQTHSIAQHYRPLQITHNRYQHHRYNKHHNNKSHNIQSRYNKIQSEISGSIEAIRQINYVGNVKPREIKNVEYIEDQDVKTIEGYEQKNNTYNPKISNRTRTKRDKKKEKDNSIERKVDSIEKRVENLKKNQKLLKVKKRNKKRGFFKKIPQNKNTGLSVLEEFIKTKELLKNRVILSGCS